MSEQPANYGAPDAAPEARDRVGRELVRQFELTQMDYEQATALPTSAGRSQMRAEIGERINHLRELLYERLDNQAAALARERQRVMALELSLRQISDAVQEESYPLAHIQMIVSYMLTPAPGQRGEGSE